MNQTLLAHSFDGINTDSLGHYLAGLGLLAVTARRWPTIRACWHDGRFKLLSDQIATTDEIKQYLLTDWRPTTYERWWSTAQKKDTKAKSSLNLWKERNNKSLDEVRLLDAHVVGMGRNCFNPVLGTGGNIGKRDLAKAWKDSVRLLSKPESSGWLDATLMGNADCGMPDLASAGTWFVFANKTFNSGQSWYREGQLSPWSFLLALEGATLLVGDVNRRLGVRSRPYAVFPFISDPTQPESDGEIGLARAEFWAPLWDNPALLCEVEALLQRGMARLGGRAARAPNEFAVAALAAGVDAGVTAFARYELRQTTSSKVFEAIPREHIKTRGEDTESSSNRRGIASKLLLELVESGWIDRLPYEPRDSKQKGKFVGLRGPVEAAIVRIGERHDDASRWQELLLKLCNTQSRIDRNKMHRERCVPLRLLDAAWFDFAFPSCEGIPDEIDIARAIASIGWPMDAKSGDLPLLANIFGVEITPQRGNVGIQFSKSRTARAVWGTGTAQQLLLGVAHRRLIDAGKLTSKPFAASCFCSAAALHRMLRDDGGIELEEVIRWIPALSLIDWSRRPHIESTRGPNIEADGTILLQALARPLFHGSKLVIRNDETQRSEPFFPQQLEPTAGLLRRVFNLIRFNSLDEAIQILRDRYLAAGRDIVMPSTGFEANGELVTASLLIPISDQAVVSGFRRWLKPSKRSSN
jgi:CRISPR-associated protein Csx17